MVFSLVTKEGSILEGSLIPKTEDGTRHAMQALESWGCCPLCILRFLGVKDQGFFRGSSNKTLREELVNYLSVSESERILEDLSKTKDTGSNSSEIESSGCQPKKIESSAAIRTEESTYICDKKEDTLRGENNAEYTRSKYPKEPLCVACVGILQEHYSSDVFLQEIQQKIKEEQREYTTYFCSLTIPVPFIVRERAIWLNLVDLGLDSFTPGACDEVIPVKDMWKWVNGSALAQLLGVPFDQKSSFEVALVFTQLDLDQECRFLYDLFPDIFRRRKQNKHGWEVFTKVNVMKAMNDLSDAKFKRCYQCPPREPSSCCACDTISGYHEQIYMAGRYQKYSRELSQTPWLVDGERKTENSIEELICTHLMDLVKAAEYRFSSSGREDVDVRMLGTGRPFLVEFMNPCRITFTREQLKALQKTVNEKTKQIQIQDLQLVTREETSILKEGETEKVKCYSALCWTQREVTQTELDKLAEIKELVLIQTTPIRVLHRRPNSERERTIHSMSAVLTDSHHFNLSLATQAGTYIKEFVHSDFGRTRPSLGELLDTDCDILELDVEEVKLDWPPALDNS